ncbi:thiamine pyrophosphate-binding protein [Ideonella sp.]|uniref:thiamine pyrophosphate-binding protein n=1 Tax=Ideonella sp. TaxID=1929293 RepID=UPI002B4655D7|nr:thiamine pyrophosphate-binding protein [Ideonella sp.]HJV68952.1 thiamine pyrophosphate-binding protein [Ideonella sp.]
MSTTPTPARSVAEIVARFLVERGVDRIFGIQGGHIQPIWDQLAQAGVRIVDVRDEGAAVHMAQAHSALSSRLGVALATAGPGVTNCVTAMANAHLERVPVLLIGGCPPRPQDDLGPLQGIDHAAILAPVTRRSRTLRVADQVARELDKAWAMAEGDGNPPGPVYVEIPTDVLRETVPAAVVLDEHLRAKPKRHLPPDAAEVTRAAALLRAARRPLVVTGRGAQGSAAALTRLLDATGAVYLDTQESRGLVDAGHPSVVGAMRAQAMQQADLVLVVGRKLDYQMAYGSPAVFREARFIRIADHADELRDNRRGEVELLADPALALDALAAAIGHPAPALDTAWTQALRAEHVRRALKYAESLLSAEPGRDGHMHPNRIFGALRQVLKPEAITIADGGDLLSFARMGLQTRHYLDAGAFGCLGVGAPYAVAAALLHPDRQVVAITGDGAFGINAMEIDTAQRHGAKAVFIVSNNAAWNIERLDQEMNYGGRVVGTTLAWSDYAAMARAFGLHAERVTDPARLQGAIEDAFANAPALIDVVVTRDALSSDAGKGLGWVPDRQALTAWDDAEQARRR